MTNYFLVTTYYPQYLRISLSSIQRYINFHQTDRFAVVINNDNPERFVSEKFAREVSGLECPLNIRNTFTNKGHLGARLDALDFLEEVQKDINYFMFVDDDDVVLEPSFEATTPTISHRACVVKRLQEVLGLIVDPNIPFGNEHIEIEEWKMGCVGVPYKFKIYYQFIQDLKPWLPQLYEIYGSDRVGEPDDVILMNLWNVWLIYTYGSLDNLFARKPANYSYALTYLEDRKGRYKVPKGVVDLRYGEWDGHTTYQSLIDPMIKSFQKFLNEKKAQS